ncbi:Transposase [Nitrosomonas sp. Nm34]|nr:Transposase [Nitrosomonas sp. Nm34]
MRLMFQDEARFGRISDCRRAWVPRPMRPLVKAMLTYEYTYAYATVCPLDGKFDSLVLPDVNTECMQIFLDVNTECMQIFLDEIARRYPNENIVMVMDSAGWHRSHSLTLAGNFRWLLLPPYSPELNPVEHLWDELREKSFHNRVFDSIGALESHLVDALRHMGGTTDPVKSIAGWDWIINSLCNAT